MRLMLNLILTEARQPVGLKYTLAKGLQWLNPTIISAVQRIQRQNNKIDKKGNENVIDKEQVDLDQLHNSLNEMVFPGEKSLFCEDNENPKGIHQPADNSMQKL